MATMPATGSPAERNLRLLSTLASKGRALSLAVLAEHLAQLKAMVHRMCRQLLSRGFLACDVNERSFTAGPALRQLAFDTPDHSLARGLRRAVWSTLAARVGATCNFTTRDGTPVLHLDRVEAHWPLRPIPEMGSHVLLRGSASSKLLLALIDQLTLAALTPNPLATAQTLLAVLQTAARSTRGLLQRSKPCCSQT